jgi:hypothetical protein
VNSPQLFCAVLEIRRIPRIRMVFWASRIRIQQSEELLRIQILLFSHKAVDRTEIMLAK